jgi:hypothetical protein
VRLSGWNPHLVSDSVSAGTKSNKEEVDSTSVWFAVRHTCEDYATWKPVFDGGRALREEYGAMGEMVFHNGNDVLGLFEMPDADSVTRFTSDPRLQEDMQTAGVIGPPEVIGPLERDA